MSVVTVDALAARRHFLCLCKESDQRRAFQQPKAGQAHPGPRAPAAKRLGSVSPVGILGRHIRVPTQNAAHRARRPAGLPTIATAEDGAPKSRAKAKALQVPRPRHLVVAFAVVLASRAPVRAWQAGRVKPAGRRTRMCAVFGRGRRPLPKIPGPIADPVRAARRARREGCAFFWLLFFAQAKKSDSRGRRTIVGHQHPPPRQRPNITPTHKPDPPTDRNTHHRHPLPPPG